MNKNIAVILAGCGYLDGAEIREAVLTLLALDMEGVNYKVFAPNKVQHHVVNHLTGEASSDEKRNVLVESARIARGQISELSELDPKEFDSLIMPGGFGAAKNLSNFAFKGSEGELDNDVKRVITSFHESKKAIGAICISPALLALALGSKKPTLTIGNDEGTATELNKLGAQHTNTTPNEIAVDKENLIVTTPAYMYDDANLKDIFSGIHSLVKEVIRF